jgi:hypothetical protein
MSLRLYSFFGQFNQKLLLLIRFLCNPFRVDEFIFLPRVAKQPWALLCNAFGVSVRESKITAKRFNSKAQG